MFRKALIALAATGIILSIAGCNTVRGLGDDIKSVGKAGEKATQ
jgi:entericidin B